MLCGIFLVEIKKSQEVGNEMAADNTQGGSDHPPSPGVIGLSKKRHRKIMIIINPSLLNKF